MFEEKTKRGKFQNTQQERNNAVELKIAKLEEMCKDNKNQIHRSTVFAENLAGSSKSLEEELLTKTNYIDFKHLKSRYEVFSQIDSIHQLETVFLPKIKTFTAMMAELQKSHQQCKDVVQNLDGKLSLKLSKSELTSIRYELQNNYI